MLQRDIFLQGEGRAWLERNRDQLGKHDPVSKLIEAQGIKPTSVLEIGCADGWRLKKLREKYHCRAWGIDPSAPPDWHPEGENNGGIWKHTAEKLPFPNYQCDLVIFGFCLYLCDPSDYFRIVAESDRVLRDGGHLVIHDFANRFLHQPYRKPYEHRAGVFAHHADFAKLWLGHPAYSEADLIHGHGGDYAILLRKDLKGAFRDA